MLGRFVDRTGGICTAVKFGQSYDKGKFIAKTLFCYFKRLKTLR